MMCPKCGNEMERGYLFSSKDGAFSGKLYGYLWRIIHPEEMFMPQSVTAAM